MSAAQSPRLSNRALELQESVTLGLNALVKRLKAEGADVVNLTAGEPDFALHESIIRAGQEAAAGAGKNRYTPVPGIPELRERVARKTNLQQPEAASRRPWKATDVVVTNGGKQAIFNFFQAVLNPGDEVVIPAPYWLSYPEMARFAAGVPKIVKTRLADGYVMSPEQLEAALTAKTRVLVLNSPSNPTGAMYTREQFRALAEVLTRHPHGSQVWVVSDEIYDRIALDRVPFCSFLSAAPELQDRTMTVNGMSKSAAMTGWRIGWSVAPQALTKKLEDIQGQSTSGICSVAQWAACAGLDLPESYFLANEATYRRRRDLVLEALSKCGKMEICRPLGAFYAFLGVRAYLRPGEDSVGLAEALLKEAGVAAVPGTPFGEEASLRISYATDERSLQEGCARIVRFLQSRDSGENKA
ncbi:MAG TPA: pyridoxal phosphate-dependent aminotransferase [Bdellovibrionota bacterium]|nr:pyridoxal phosphate-dependent aminotransferase [Bdellovibrionota bacterium]